MGAGARAARLPGAGLAVRGEADRYKVLTRRAFLLAGGKLALFTLLAGRMYQLQVIESERYATLAEDNRINLRLLPPERGRIVDRFGEPLAYNRQNYRVTMVAEKAGNARQVLDSLAQIVPLSEHERARLARELDRSRRFIPVTVRENLSWSDVAAIEVNAPDMPGVATDVGRSRFYPYVEETAHLIGYVAAASEKDQARDDDPLLELPNFPVGKDGMERQHDQSLRGSAGASEVEVNAVGRIIRELSREEGEQGHEVTLAVDLAVQRLAYERFGEESGAAVVMDVETGEILALVSVPGYDPNVFAEGILGERWRALLADAKAPLLNKAVAGQYAPGSTYKMVVALAALESGLVDTTSRVSCSGAYQFGDGTFHCWKREGHGAVDMETAIKVSCDVYFYETARRIGVDRIAAMARRFGLGRPTAIDLAGEKAGLIPSRDWKRAAMGQVWHQGETLVAGIGQGYVLSTPLQLAVMTARLVNGGKAVVPRITRAVRGEDRPDPPPPGSLGVAPEMLEVILRGMDGVVNGGGTAAGIRIADPNMQIGGKTGTSQVRRITAKEREGGVKKNDELPWHQRDHALFVGYGPVHQPRYAVAVLVEHGGGGARVAAPIARDILRLVLERDPSRRTHNVAEKA